MMVLAVSLKSAIMGQKDDYSRFNKADKYNNQGDAHMKNGDKQSARADFN
jgi:hypothetical protein